MNRLHTVHCLEKEEQRMEIPCHDRGFRGLLHAGEKKKLAIVPQGEQDNKSDK
jgi:hypothetical protein